MRTQSLDSIKREINPDEEVINLRGQIRDLKRRLDEYKKDTGSLKSFFRDVNEALFALPKPTNYYRKPARRMKVESPITAVAHDTDGHMGAVQQPDEIEGFNAFNPDICRARKMLFVEKFLKWVEVHRSAYTVDELVWISTGDLISGDIHDELKITNAFPSPVQVVEAGTLLADQLAYLSPHFKTVRVEFITEDNHARLTKKPQAKEAGMNSLNYLVGYIAKQRLANFGNVQFNLHPMYQKTIEVQGRRYLCTHGHNVKGWAGFPFYGLARMASNESMRRMMRNIGKFDRVILGHYHTPLRHPWYWIGGSVQGTDAYDHKNGRQSQPSQGGWMVHPKHGEFDVTDFYLGDI